MRVIKGIPVSEGIAIGRVFALEDDHLHVPRRVIAPDQVVSELERLERAIEAAVEDLRRVHGEAARQMGDEAAKIFLFHIGMLGDASVLDPVRARIGSKLEAAEYAVFKGFEVVADKFEAMPDSAFKTKVNDIYDLCARLLDQLGGERRLRLGSLERDTIVIAKDLTPSETAGFDREHILGFATDLGGRTSHTAIVARALGLPAVVGCQTVSVDLEDAAMVIIDGDRGLVVVDPDEETLERYRGYIAQAETFRLSMAELAGLPSVTTDGVVIGLNGNIEFPEEIETVLASGGDGIGLYRSEFLYLTGDHEPSEEEHYESYMACLEKLGPDRELVIRTVDLGADKYTQARTEIPERNPALGNRSIRLSLRSLPMFKTQLRAILRASAHGHIKVMFPLVTTLGELRHAKMILRDVMEDLDEEGVPFDQQIPVGMMVEVPSAAVMADSFAKEVDFFSIGTNDLIQYTLAVDRTNERVADLYRPTNPAVIRLIREVVKAARRRQIPVSVCGEAAGELEYAVLLVGLGLRTLSATASRLPQLKRLLRSLSITQCERMAKKALTFDSDVEVSAYLRARTRKIVPEAFDGRAVEERT